jgi:hypothetical protein
VDANEQCDNDNECNTLIPFHQKQSYRQKYDVNQGKEELFNVPSSINIK